MTAEKEQHGHGTSIHHVYGTEAFESALGLVNVACGWILLASVTVALLNVALLILQHLTGYNFRMVLAVTQPQGSALTLDRIKLELGRLLAFSLLLLVAADVLETLMKPMHDVAMEELYKMAMVGAIRTALAYFLGKELEEVMHHIEHAESHHDASDDHAAPAYHAQETTKQLLPPAEKEPVTAGTANKKKKKKFN
jgi:uncharacterized membrane protein